MSTDKNPNDDAINDMPKRLKYLHKIMWPVAHVERVFWIAIFLVFASHFVDSYFKSSSYLPIAGSIISVLGLVLTIKHSFLKNLETTRQLARSKYISPSARKTLDEQLQDRDFRYALYKCAIDEGSGVLFVIIGTLVNTLGPKVPLIILCNNLN